MKIVVLGGSGTIGSAVAWDLVQDPEVEWIGLVGTRAEKLERTRQWLASPRVRCHVTVPNQPGLLLEILRQYDTAVLTLPDRRSDFFAMEQVIEAGLHAVDVIEDYHRCPEPFEIEQLQVPKGFTLEEYGEYLHQRASDRGLIFLDGVGFAPGLSNVTVGHGIRQLDKAEIAIARVGGIPTREAASQHPLGYMITWDFAHVLREYMVRLKVIKAGKVTQVPACSDVEPVRFMEFGRDELLEGANTAGMPSFLHTRPQLKEFAEKTLRWPGHWQAIQTLKECGLFDLEPIPFGEDRIVPRDFLTAVLTPRLQRRPGEGDVCVMVNTVEGLRNGQRTRIEYRMWEESDPTTGLTAMQRTTAFPAAIAARMVAKGQITGRGILPSEDAITGELYFEFLRELQKRQIRIEEVQANLNQDP